MTYMRALAIVSRLLRPLMRGVRTDSKLWATLADWDGHISFRQIDYARRVQAANPWKPVGIRNVWVTAPPTTATNSQTTTVTWGSQEPWR